MARRRKSVNSKRRGNRVIIYIRVSDTTGREDSLISHKVQEEQARRLCAAEGLDVVDVIRDLDLSGRSSDKRSIHKIIDRVEKKEADGVVVWKISRWGRNTIDSMLNLGELQDAGGYILSATENLNEIDTPAGVFQLTVLLAIAQMYSDEIGKTWANIHDYRRGSGRTHNGSPRLGYLYVKHIEPGDLSNFNVVEGSDYVVDPQKGPWVRKAFEWYVAGETLPEIARRLQEAGIRSTRGKVITISSLRGTLDSGFAAGLIVDRRGDAVEYTVGKHEALVPAAIWEAYLRRKAVRAPARTKSAPYRVARLMHCAACGAPMAAQWRVNKRTRVKQRFFRCSRVQKARGALCPAPAVVDESRVEGALLDWLRANAAGEQAKDTAIARAQAVGRAEVDGAKIAKEISRLERGLVRLYDDMVAGKVSEPVYQLKEAQLVGELARLKESLDSVSLAADVNAMPSMTVFGAVLLGWQHMTPAVLNEALRTVVSEIVVHKGEKKWAPCSVQVVGRWEPSVAARARERWKAAQEEADEAAREEVGWKPLVERLAVVS